MFDYVCMCLVLGTHAGYACACTRIIIIACVRVDGRSFMIQIIASVIGYDHDFNPGLQKMSRTDAICTTS